MFKRLSKLLKRLFIFRINSVYDREGKPGSFAGIVFLVIKPEFGIIDLSVLDYGSWVPEDGVYVK